MSEFREFPINERIARFEKYFERIEDVSNRLYKNFTLGNNVQDIQSNGVVRNIKVYDIDNDTGWEIFRLLYKALEVIKDEIRRLKEEAEEQ